MNTQSDQIDKLVEQVVRQVEDRLRAAKPTDTERWKPTSTISFRERAGVFKTVDEAVAKAKEVAPAWAAYDKTKKNIAIENIRRRLLEHNKELSELAVRETGLGRAEDKLIKNALVTTKTPGTEILKPYTETGPFGLMMTDFAPYGVIGSITPTTNPSETIINNGIGMLAAGNTVVFNPHPSAKEVSARTVEIMNRAAEETGAPTPLLCSVSKPTIDSATELMRHKDVRLLVVTGGPAVVRAAMNSGKKVIAAGPGNPPAVVDDTADIENAGRSIVRGSSLDNNIVCIVEKEVIALKTVVDPLKQAMQRNGAYYVNEKQRDRLEKVLVIDGHVNKDFIGKDAAVILREIGISVGKEVRVVICDATENHSFVQLEMLMPVLPVVAVDTFEEAIAMAKRVEHDFRHTAVIHSRNIERIHRMGRLMNCSLFVSNAPSFAALAQEGEGYTSFTIASPTGEGCTTARHFSRERRFTIGGHLNMV